MKGMKFQESIFHCFYPNSSDISKDLNKRRLCLLALKYFLKKQDYYKASVMRDIVGPHNKKGVL